MTSKINGRLNMKILNPAFFLILFVGCLGVNLSAFGNQFVNIAHRGARSVAPENTIPSFEIGIRRFNADMIELDVHLTKDGVPVVVHDDTLERCSDVEKKFPGRSPWRVGDFTMAELHRLDAGTWFVTTDPFGQIKAGKVPREDVEYFSSGRVKIPSLRSVLLLVKELDCFVNIELKNYPAFYPQLAEKVLEVVEETGVKKKVIFSSFEHEILLRIGQLAPEIPRAALVEQPIFPVGPYVRDLLGCVAYNPGKDVLGCSSESYRQDGILRSDIVAQAHAAGLSVYVWTVNDPEEIDELQKIGVDGVFTDFPQILSPHYCPKCRIDRLKCRH